MSSMTHQGKPVRRNQQASKPLNPDKFDGYDKFHRY